MENNIVKLMTNEGMIKFKTKWYNQENKCKYLVTAALTKKVNLRVSSIK